MRPIELVLWMGAVCLSLLKLSLVATSMASTSLWTDELGSIGYFLPKGGWWIATNYPMPRNHIFYHILASLFPGSDSFEPLQARALSFLLVGTSIVYACGRFLATGRATAGAVFIIAYSLADSLVEISLQARGYGLLCLLALITSERVYAFLQHNRVSDYVWIGLCTVLGVYTIPSYLIFGGVVMFVLFLLKPRRRTFWTGVASALAILALYSPVLHEVLHWSRVYEREHGKQYASHAQILETFQSYIFPAPTWGVALLGLATLVGPYLLWRLSRQSPAAAYVLVGCSLFFLLWCRWQETPPVRTTTFIAMPFLFVVASLTQSALEAMKSHPRRGIMVSCGVALLLIGALQKSLSSYQFLEWENWTAAVRFVEKMNPPESNISVTSMADGYTYYMDQEQYGGQVIAPELGVIEKALAHGPVVDSRWAFKNVVDSRPEKIASSSFQEGVDIRIAGKIRNVYIHMLVPPISNVASFRVNRQEIAGEALTDRNVRTGVDLPVLAGGETLSVEIDAGRESKPYSLTLYFDASLQDLKLEVDGNQNSKGEVMGTMVVLPMESGTLRLKITNLLSAPVSPRLMEGWITNWK